MKTPSIKYEKIDITLGNRIELKRPDGVSMIIEHLSDSTLSTLLSKFMRDLCVTFFINSSILIHPPTSNFHVSFVHAPTATHGSFLIFKR
jgi:hypothetical protein